MKKIILRFGLFAMLISVGIGFLSFFTFGKYLNYTQQEVLGYSSIFLALSMIVLAIRQHLKPLWQI